MWQLVTNIDPQMMIGSDERILWRYCLKGDMDAFRNLYLLYYPRLTAYGRHLVGDASFVEDCIQDLFVKMIQNSGTLSDTEHLSAYLFKALRHKIFDSLRGRKPIVEFDSELPFFEANMACSPQMSTEEGVSEERMRFVMNTLNELSPSQQEAVYLYYTKGLTHEEIASVMGINYQSSKNLLCRAVARLRRIYAERYAR